jgi:hypothetical protein
MKYWIEGRHIVIITPDNLLFGDYSEKDLNAFKKQIDNDVIPSQITGVSLSYIRTIEKDEKTKTIDIELGKGTTDRIKFDSKQLRDAVFDHLRSSNKLTAVNPSSSEIWRPFWKTVLSIIAIAILMLLLKAEDLNNFYVGTKPIGLAFVAFAQKVDDFVIVIIALLTIISFFFLSRQRVKGLKGVTRLMRT